MSMMLGNQSQIPVSLLTGFLGAGKTTVLNRLVRDPALAKTLVIINEFGSIGIDHDLLALSEEDVVVEMSSGCLCCTIRGDLVRTLRDAPWRFARSGVCWFDRVVIETTGLADPAPILHTLMTDERLVTLYRIDGVVTAVDAVNGMATLDAQEESRKQAAVADRMLLTKTDLATPEQSAAIEARLRALNPAAPIIRTVDGAVEASQLFDVGLYNPQTKSLDVQRWLNAEAYESDHDHGHHHHGHGHDHDHYHHHHDINRHDASIHAVCLSFDEPLDAEAFDFWLHTLMMLKGPDVLRVKGIVNIAGFDKPMVLHGVQQIFHPPVMLDAWPSEDRRTRMVFITRGLDEATLRDTLTIMTQSVQNYQLNGPAGSPFNGPSPLLLPGDPGFDLVDLRL
ncbi:MAG: GTP-binding protein [Porphyrobacter sp.]|nr:GTP-binding protein [Porphyrobacter sp.]